MSRCNPLKHSSMPIHWMLHSLAPFAKLRSLTELWLPVGQEEFYPLADVVRALVSLTRLAELNIIYPQPAVVPAALGQLKGLQSVDFLALSSCVLEAGCFDLPKLLSLESQGAILRTQRGSRAFQLSRASPASSSRVWFVTWVRTLRLHSAQ